MEDAIFLSILVSFSVLLNSDSLPKSIALIFSFLSPILSSFMCLFFLSTRAHLYSLVLLIYAVGLGTNNKVISALVLVIVFIHEMYRSSKIIENITWIFFFLILSASFWLDIDSLTTYTPILLYGFVQI